MPLTYKAIKSDLISRLTKHLLSGQYLIASTLKIMQQKVHKARLDIHRLQIFKYQYPHIKQLAKRKQQREQRMHTVHVASLKIDAKN